MISVYARIGVSSNSCNLGTAGRKMRNRTGGTFLMVTRFEPSPMEGFLGLKMREVENGHGG